MSEKKKGLLLDVGRNEHPPTPDYALYLRRALDQSRHGAETQIVGPDWHTGSPAVEGPLSPFMEALHENATVRAAISRVGFHCKRADHTFSIWSRLSSR